VFVLRVEDSGDFADLMRRTDRFDKVLSSALRTEIRVAAQEAVAAVKDRVRSGTYTADVGTRADIAAGSRLQMETTTKAAGVRIIATGENLPDDRKLMVAAWQKVSFKHPAFGDKAVIITQPGQPYFFQTITEKQPRVTAAVQRAMQRAAAALAGGNA
jgi:hypothetical protein